MTAVRSELQHTTTPASFPLWPSSAGERHQRWGYARASRGGRLGSSPANPCKPIIPEGRQWASPATEARGPVVRQIGFVTLAHLSRLQQAGPSPKQAVELTRAEARRRYPNARAIILQGSRDGFSVVAL